MSVGRLGTVLRVRALVERRRRAEAAVADRRWADAVQERARREHARDQAAAGTARRVTADAVVADRLGALALGEAVDQAEQEERIAARDAEVAAQRRAEAGVDRRSAERLYERRMAEIARELSRRTERQLDDAGLELWRRRT